MVDRVTVTQFHQPSQIHDGDAVADIFHHAQVMGYENICKVKMLLQLLKQVNDLGLYGHVKSRYRFIADDHSGITGNGPGNVQPLALSPRKLMGISV